MWKPLFSDAKSPTFAGTQVRLSDIVYGESPTVDLAFGDLAPR
jgi:hypothetical protein